MSGLVSQYVLRSLAKQIEQERIVVWYDPDQDYAPVMAEIVVDPGLLPAGTRVVCYEESFFQIRYAVEPLIRGNEPPLMLVYVPLDPQESENALVEIETLGVVLDKTQTLLPRNTRLSMLAREALTATVGYDAAQQIADEVERGKLNLTELDALAERSEGLRGVLSTIYDGATEPTALLLAFLTRPDKDTELRQRGAVGNVEELLKTQTGHTTRKASDPQALRRQFARYLLMTDLAVTVTGDLPPTLDTGSIAATDPHRRICSELACAFRLRRDLGAAYVALADTVATEVNLARQAASLPALEAVETFRETEQELQRRTEERLVAATAAQEIGEAAALAQVRLGGFWSEAVPEVQARWALIASVGRLLAEADRVASALKAAGSAPSPSLLLKAYAAEENPWCLLDTYHRNLERRWVNFDFDSETDGLERLLAAARRRYAEVAGPLAETFSRAMQRAHFAPDAARLSLLQREIFAQRVRPLLGKFGEKVAYFLVDALRYEMARELAGQIKEDVEDLIFEAAFGTMPSITEIGMAALMPGAEGSDVGLVPGRLPGKVGLQIDGKLLADRNDRVEYLKGYLQERHGLTAYDLRLEDLLPRPARRLETAIKKAGFLLVTSQEIDALCESGNVPLARRTMDDMLHQIRRGLRNLAALGVTRVVCVSDHGYLFVEELQDDMKIDAPGGDTVDLHRRVWIGRGGASELAYVRATAHDFGLGGDLEMAMPCGLACFKAPGSAVAYFHGGISPQEIVIPVMTATLRRAKAETTAWHWTLRPGSKKITTRFCSATVEGIASALFDTAPPRIRLELRAGGQVISSPVAASYGFEEATGDVVLRKRAETEESSGAVVEPNTITLMLREGVTAETASLHLIDADLDLALHLLDDLTISISL